ncbi:TipJ family phage tail tip protein [Syntrophobacter fumaroxidans]|uniref:Phage-related protein tail component-like n=1 Tax=Syntrophobacter fumaroxidans (strain DSM 10017 / MPOB) TaxID=335543 RepID=A0LJH6_SYNFM|nr:phage tail protein [Syntrophobacter fumaroxidans]ABK17578.1 Phage-related protein tail component-like [Syntrophobacter fumaroxidans MPOB]
MSESKDLVEGTAPVPPGHLRVVSVDHPFRRSERRIDLVEWKPGMSLSDVVASRVPENLPVKVFLDGLEIAPGERSRVYPMPGRQVLIVPELGFDDGFKGILRFILQIALVAAGFIMQAMGVPGWLIFGTMLVGGILINVLLPPQAPKKPDTALDSQAYNWAPQNTEQQGVPVPRWYGKNRIYGNIVASHIENRDSTQILNALICLGLGPVKSLGDFRINDQAIKHFKAVHVRVRYGRLNQAPISDFKKTKIEYPASVKVVHGSPYTYTTVGNDFDALEVDISFPEGLWHYPPESSGLEGFAVRFQIAVRKVGTSTWHHIARQPSDVAGYNKVFVSGARWSLGKWVDPGADPDWTGHEGADVWFENLAGTSGFYDHYEGEVYPDQTELFWHWIGDDGGEYIATSTDSYEVWQDYFDAFGQSEKPRHWTMRYRVPDGEKGQYQVRVTRVTPTATPQNRYGQDMYFAGVAEVLCDPFEYPRHVLVAVSARATDQLSGSLRFSCVGEMAVIRVFDGSSWSIEYSNNPAWVAYDILSQPVIGGAGTEANPYTVLRYDGLPPERLDAPKFLEWAQYCDEKVSDGTGSPFSTAVAYAVNDRVRYAGRIYMCIQATAVPSPPPTDTAYWAVTNEGLEKRITFNGGFDYDTSMWEAVARVCQVGRAIPVWNGSKLTVAIDKPADPVNLYTVGNIEESKFREIFLPLEERATEIEVDFIDGETWERDKLTVYRPDIARSTGYRAAIELFGVTKRSEAWRAGMFRLMCNKYLVRTVELDLDVEAVNADIGDVVHIQHDVPQWGEGGRIAPVLSFTSGGPYEIKPGDTVIGGTSWASARVVAVDVTSGSWAAGTAAGRLTLAGQSGNFVAEELNVLENFDVATVIASRVTLDKAVSIEAGLTCKVIVRLSGDSLAERIVTSEAGSHETLSVSVPFDPIPAPFDVYAFGQVDTITRPFRVLSIRKSMEQKCTLSLIEYRPEVYQYEDSAPNPGSAAQLALKAMQPRRVKLTEISVDGPGGRQVKGIDIDFEPCADPAFKHYEVWYRVAGRKGEKAEWLFSGVADGSSYQVLGVERQTRYAVALLPVDTANRKLFIEYAASRSILIHGIELAADLRYKTGTTVDALEPAEAGATLGSTLGNGSTVPGNLKKSDGATLVTEQDLFLDGLWARAITLTDGGYFRTGLSPDPRIIISKGQIAGYSDETTKEFYLLASTGKAYLGGGNVILESTGVRILPVTGQTWDSTRSVNWGTNVSYPIARIWAWNDTFDDSLVIEVNGDYHFSQGGHMYFRAYGVGSGNHSTIKFNASNDSYAVALEMNTESDGRFRVDADVIQLKTTPSGGGIVNIDAYTIYLGGVVTILAGQIKSTLETGTAPMTVASTTKVTNLNADQVDGKDAADFFPINGGQLTGANISRNVDDSYLNVHGATNVTSGAGVTLYGRDHATCAGNMYLTFGGYASTGKLVIRNRNASEYNNVFEIDSVGNIVTSALRIGAYVNDSYLSICAGEDGLKGASLVMYGRAHASSPGEAYLNLGGYTPYGKFTIRQRLTDESLVNLFLFDKDANLRIGGTTFGTSAARVLCVGTGTAPTSSPADAFQMYSKDISAGNAAPHFRLEGGPELRLYQQPHIADPDADSTSLQTAVKAILVALENMRFLATS